MSLLMPASCSTSGPSLAVEILKNLLVSWIAGGLLSLSNGSRSPLSVMILWNSVCGEKPAGHNFSSRETPPPSPERRCEGRCWGWDRPRDTSTDTVLAGAAAATAAPPAAEVARPRPAAARRLPAPTAARPSNATPAIARPRLQASWPGRGSLTASCGGSGTAAAGCSAGDGASGGFGAPRSKPPGMDRGCLPSNLAKSARTISRSQSAP
mmetsp:Transcript_97674/g.315357  ORF Transcript_97674/g.315357 Transcript_97674/m.315357 type:complete len:210 (-) Transcript_97674:332-961(-)